MIIGREALETGVTHAIDDADVHLELFGGKRSADITESSPDCHPRALQHDGYFSCEHSESKQICTRGGLLQTIRSRSRYLPWTGIRQERKLTYDRSIPQTWRTARHPQTQIPAVGSGMQLHAVGLQPGVAMTRMLPVTEGAEGRKGYKRDWTERGGTHHLLPLSHTTSFPPALSIRWPPPTSRPRPRSPATHS